ncbi:hypothetical protein [Coralloluteibacterium stylophorae]|uniref:Uncharacterized protein n=1 Tax=Coralloluteibacterium stylophorae TaxID=1776034 RepID=A0A8J7VZ60_9GAMM|nr:hypothetical protein [Coralloluteibacterium stylophorae]MBS7456071.1 hypothetical protein [Coralloluteibacterium stylophorae]
MTTLPTSLLAAALALAGSTAPALAQTTATDTAVLPVWNHDSGKVEALLLLEPAEEESRLFDAPLPPLAPRPGLGLGASRTVGDGVRLRSSLEAEPMGNLALLCNGRSGLAATLGGLAEHCLLARMDDQSASGGRLGFEAQLERGDASVSIEAGVTRSRLQGAPLAGAATAGSSLPQWLSINPLSALPVDAQVRQDDLGARGVLQLGSDGWLEIGGTVARARLVPANDAAAALLPDQWDTTSVGVGAGYGAFSGSVIGRVTELPGQDDSFGSLGLGLSWRTPWQGRLSVGADNIVTRGKNPWSSTTGEETEDAGRVPYVRYQQDL